MKIVVVCLEFSGAVGPQRMRSLSEGITLRGHDVVFVTSEGMAEDPRFRVIGIPFERTGARLKAATGLSTGQNLAAEAGRRARILERLVRVAARTFETLFQHPDKYRGWIGACRSWLESNPPELSGVDVVLATSPPVTTLYCGLAIARHTRSPIVLDFRDLWTDNPYYPFGWLRRILDQFAERRLVAQSAALTCATPMFGSQLAARHPGTAASAVLTGVDPTPWQAGAHGEATGLLRIGHFGSTYAGFRNMKPLMESLGRLADGGLIDLSRVSIELYGDIDESTLVAAHQGGLDSTLHPHGWIPPYEVPVSLGTVDVALLLVWPGDMSSIPLKTYHYLAAGKTILLLGARPGSQMRRILEPLPGVDCPDTPAQLDACILRYSEMARVRADFSWTLEQRPLPATRETMTTAFLEVIQQVISQ